MGMKNFFFYGITHLIKWKSSDNYAEKFALQILLPFPCNLMDNFDWDFFLFFHRFFRGILFSMEFSPEFYGKCTDFLMASSGYFISYQGGQKGWIAWADRMGGQEGRME
jgi:hypothetical protein